MARPTPDYHREAEEARDNRSIPMSAAELSVLNAADERSGRAPHQIAKDMPRKWPW